MVCVSLSRVTLIECWSAVEKMSLSLSPGRPSSSAFDGQPHLAVGDAAADRGVFDFGGGFGGDARAAKRVSQREQASGGSFMEWSER